MTWAQYNLGDPNPAIIQATTESMVDPIVMKDAGRGQAEIPADIIDPVVVDVSQEPPVFDAADFGTPSSS